MFGECLYNIALGAAERLVNFAKFAATSPSRRAEAQGFEAVLLTTGNKLLTGSTVVAFQRGRTSKHKSQSLAAPAGQNLEPS
jgi:hypothetical protein